MFPRTMRGAVAVTLMSTCLVLVTASCTGYSDVGQGVELLQSDLAEGDHIKIVLLDGDIIYGDFVRFNDTELVCEEATVELKSIDYVCRRDPDHQSEVSSGLKVLGVAVLSVVAIIVIAFANWEPQIRL